MPDGESIYHHIALTALITLHGVDSDVVEFFYAITVDGLPYCGYLIAVRYYYSQRLPDGETAFTQSLDCDSYARNDVGLEGVYLVGGRLWRAWYVDERHTPCEQQGLVWRVVAFRRSRQLALLVWQRNRL